MNGKFGGESIGILRIFKNPCLGCVVAVACGAGRFVAMRLPIF